MWPLWILLPLCFLLVAALVLLYRRHSRLSRDRANAVLSRDRANSDLQMSIHVNHKLQRAFREAQGQEDILQEGSSSLSFRRSTSLSCSRGPPSSLPPGPPSSSAQSLTEPSRSLSPVAHSAAQSLTVVPGAPRLSAWAVAWHAERARAEYSGVALPAPTPSAAPTRPVACSSAAEAARCAGGRTAPPKRPAPSGSASTPRAKRAFTSPYHEFCKGQRPSIPPGLSNRDREKLLGERVSWPQHQPQPQPQLQPPSPSSSPSPSPELCPCPWP